jgi:hypothetical protein
VVLFEESLRNDRKIGSSGEPLPRGATVGDAGQWPLRFPDQGITLVGQLKCTSAVIEIRDRLGVQAGGHRDSHEGISLVG